ncbi:MAG: GNAT family N-acetyltransferase [Chloroflexi bacterium]|nr:GNAT family N-acetyltransferase [Chloroflexota bacterium]
MSASLITRHSDAAAFLSRTQAALLEHESANNLMLGLCLRLQRHPERTERPPYFATVEEDGELAAAAVMTPPYNLIIFGRRGADLAPWHLVADDLLHDAWPVPGVVGPAEAAEAFARVWTGTSGCAYRLGMRERVYELRQVIPPADPGGGLRLATESDLELAAAWAVAFILEAGLADPPEQTRKNMATKIADRMLYLWEVGGVPVSLAAGTRPGVHCISVGPVYTPPEHRCRGYASACVAALSRRLLDSGWEFCTLFTNLANPTSNSIYQKIGYRPVCDFNEYRWPSCPEIAS